MLFTGFCIFQILSIMEGRKNIVSHKGTVTKVEDGRVYVNIQTASACASCHIKGSCNLSGTSPKVVEVTTDKKQYKPGDVVEVYFSESLGYRALFLGYVLPFIVLMVTLIGLLELTNNEAIAGLSAIGILIPYYIILYFRREKIRKTFSFQIQKPKDNYYFA